MGDQFCRKCGGTMEVGKAIMQTFRSSPYLGPGIVTISPRGPVTLVDCLKCEECGWSVTPREGEG